MATVLLREDWVTVTTNATSLSTLIKAAGGVVADNLDTLVFILGNGQTLYYSTTGQATSGEKPISFGQTNKPMKASKANQISLLGSGAFSFLLEQYGEV